MTDYHNHSLIQHYAIKMTDYAEYYFRGDRFLDSKRNYLLKSIRYLSFLTILPPVVIGLAYLIANGLVKPDNSDHSKAYWKDKVIFPHNEIHPFGGNVAKKTQKQIRKLFRKSGVKETSFEKIVIVRCSKYSSQMIYTADGRFPAFSRLYPTMAKNKVLTISINWNGADACKSKRIEERQRGLNSAFSLAFKKTPIAYCKLNSNDYHMIDRWKKLPNEVKQLLSLEPNSKSVYIT
jgi:hypothetical protein